MYYIGSSLASLSTEAGILVGHGVLWEHGLGGPPKGGMGCRPPRIIRRERTVVWLVFCLVSDYYRQPTYDDGLGGCFC